jgi:zinc D-Ala-D-Ala carboxypeptidase
MVPAPPGRVRPGLQRLVPVVFVPVLLACVLTACGTSDASIETRAPDSTPTPTASAPAPAPTSAGSSDAETTADATTSAAAALAIASAQGSRSAAAGRASSGSPAGAATSRDASASGTPSHRATTRTGTPRPKPTASVRSRGSTLSSGPLRSGERLTSPSRAFSLVMQGDGNLVLYGPGGPTWSSGTAVPGAYADLQAGGSLVVFAAGRGTLWSSYSDGHPGAALMLRDDGVLVLAKGATVLWDSSSAAVRTRAAKAIAADPAIVLTTTHVTGHLHYASTAKQEIADTAAQRMAMRSPWSDVGATPVWLHPATLDAMVRLHTQYGFSYSVTEIAGGDHSRNSWHYRGRAIDVGIVNGVGVSRAHYPASFMQACRDLGATEVLGPGYPGHDLHVHCAWEH